MMDQHIFYTSYCMVSTANSYHHHKTLFCTCMLYLQAPFLSQLHNEGSQKLLLHHIPHSCNGIEHKLCLNQGNKKGGMGSMVVGYRCNRLLSSVPDYYLPHMTNRYPHRHTLHKKHDILRRSYWCHRYNIHLYTYIDHQSLIPCDHQDHYKWGMQLLTNK